jgi:hypothetical protein
MGRIPRTQSLLNRTLKEHTYMESKFQRGAVWSLVVSLALAQAAQAAQLTQYWPFEEAPGSTSAANLVAGGNTATLEELDPDHAWVAHAPNQLAYSTRSVALGDVGGYINLGNIGLKDSATVSLWINPADYFWGDGDLRLYSQVPFVPAYGGVVRMDPFVTGQIQSIASTGDWQSLGSLDLIPAGVWTHLAFVYQEGSLKLWVDGTPLPASLATGFEFDAADFGLGARFDIAGAIGGPFGNTFDGYIDDVSIWDGPLSADSISKLANGTRPTEISDVPEPPTAATLVQYWPFEESAGSTQAPNAVAGGNVAYLVESDPSTAWVKTDKPAALAHSTTSLAWDEIDDYVNLGNINLKGAGTISMWIKPTATSLNANSTRLYSLLTTPENFSGVAAIGVSALPSGVMVRETVLVYQGGWQRIGSSGSIPADQWTHFVITYGGGRATLYLNGERQLSAPCGLDFEEAELGLGARFGLDGGLGGPHGTAYGGLMDDVSIWDRALQPSSIRQLASGVSPLEVTDSPETEPPTILTQPVAMTAVLGEPASFSVVAGGAGTMAYQWYKGAEPIHGATSDVLTLEAVQLSDHGDYQVIVTNEFGSATSLTVRLTVDPGVPNIITQPQDLVKREGAPTTFTVVATGAQPLSYQWFKDASAIPDATGVDYTIAAVSASDAGDYSVVVSNVSGSIHSAAATLTLVLTPPAINVNLIIEAGSHEYQGTAAAPDAATMWNQVTEAALEADANRETALVDSDGVPVGIKFFSGSFIEQGGGGDANGGGNALQSTYWHVGAGNVTPEFGFRNLDPANEYDVYIYGIATDFGLGRTQQFNRGGGESKPLQQVPNTGWPVVNEDYVVFSGVTGVSEVVFTAGDLGNENVFSTVTGLQIIEPSDVPFIRAHPVSRFVRPASAVTFSVDASGASPLIYQWRKNGINIPGAQGAAYTLASVQLADAGEFSVVVSNAAGSVTSQAATLRVQTAPPAVNVNLISEAVTLEYVGTAAAPDVGTTWNQVLDDTLLWDPDREMELVDSDGMATVIRFFSGSFVDRLANYAGDNGGGNSLQATYWHVGGGNVSPEFGFRNLDPAQIYDVYVYGIVTDFGTGWGQAYSVVGGPTKTLKQLPNTGFPVEGEDYVVFRGLTGLSELRLTAGQAGGYFSTVCGLQIIAGEALPASLSISRSAGNAVTISWTGAGMLEQADQMNGGWSDAPSQANPQTLAPSATQRFYRVRP